MFATLEEAAGVLEERLDGWAFEDCQGAYNVGRDEYTQEFIVDGKHYMATAKYEYNRPRQDVLLRRRERIQCGANRSHSGSLATPPRPYTRGRERPE